ncbi:NAD(P)/FAD-dependent oxidoreductase [Methanospirillum sp. J.3.6.1-F.2.7.3]|uniref:NAD(P)/FAD-dependent oxidoreductase n=1 Tax=Methanospirillum purgamenti TaxID=2834276 RepID=A0A8E7EKW8_9EURY|nr:MULTISPECIES: NAD(P)/FAD-dependent oxidoreductase [Methanospirillum]MDX8550776.1 NAD(P)/FAD-dependent oxidoreductase [Methanospirillum hungatei]QVV89985.1 NAD(P)/FAD-dependent oxidoreductase [Methanospirillum sp. J.3.6.1-F.2.7.3]
MKKINGAILQRDGKTYGIMTNTPAGMITSEDLEQIAAVGRKFHIPVMKITSGQRIILAGIPADDVDNVFKELGTLGKPDLGPCVKFVQGCLGTEMCKWGAQDSIGLASRIEILVQDKKFPAKIKIGVSGCQRCCSESQLRDIGLIGTTRGWIVLFGGNGGRKPRIADPIAYGLSTDEACDLVSRLLEYYQIHGESQERTARFMERIGIETLKSELLSMIPYINLDKV